jgi:predicted amidohydrolase YtcJ
MELAGINGKTPDPENGVLQRDIIGNPTGILFEEAVKLIEKVIPNLSVEQAAEAILKAQESLWKMGITGVHDFDRELCIQALQYLSGEGQLNLRVLKSIPSEFLDQAIQLGYRTGKGNDWLWFGGVKDFMDGALGPKTAAMLAPYQGSDEMGMLLKSEDEIIQLGKKAADHGLSLSIHAIGDLANRTLLNALEKIRAYEKETGLDPLPHRIEHVQLIDPMDLPRLADLDIIASMQPIHATSDMEMADLYWGDRTAFAYAPKLQLDQGAEVIFGSDAPVETPNPWLGIHAAVTRRQLDGAPGAEGWHPEGRISIDQALAAFTTNPARAAGRGKSQGKLAPGYWADLILLDRDPLRTPAGELPEIQPLGTMVAGEWVFRDF